MSSSPSGPDVRAGVGPVRREKPRLDADPVFVVGCPRSGTTWLQLLLAEHPDVVTAPETQIFSYYLTHLRRRWKRERETCESDGQGKAGLSRVFSEEEFDDLCRDVALRVLSTIASRDPQAGTVVEKSPQHALHVEWIHDLLDEARILHVIRDPRDTAASLMAAGRSWGKNWAPRGPVEAGRMWRRHIEQGRRGLHREERYREVRYEALKRDAPGELLAVFEWLGLDSDEEFCEEAARACRLSRLRERADGGQLPTPGEKSPDDFFRKGKTGGWRDELSASQIGVIERICGPLMRELDYGRTDQARWLASWRVTVHDALRRTGEALDWQLERISRPI